MHSLAVVSTGDVYAAGSNQQGQLGLPGIENSDAFAKVHSCEKVKVQRCFAGGDHSFLLLNDYLQKVVQPKDDIANFIPEQEVEFVDNNDYDLRGSFTPEEQVQASPFNDRLDHLTQPLTIQCNYTDTKLSHRFARFELDPRHLSHLEQYLVNLKAEGQILLYKLQLDQDITQDGVVVSQGRSEANGLQIVTLQMVADMADSLQTQGSLDDMSQFSFIDRLYNQILKYSQTQKSTIFTQVQKTTIGVQTILRIGNGQGTNEEREQQFNQWASNIRAAIYKATKSLPLMLKFFELRPYQFCPALSH